MGETGVSETEQKEEKEPGGKNAVIKISGNAVLNRIDARGLNVSGTARIKGPVNVGSMDISGGARVEGPINCEGVLNVSGSLKTSNDITAEEILGSGSISARNSKSNLFSMTGMAYLDGTLSSDRIEESGTIKAKNIKGRSMKFNGVVKADSIEVGSIDLHGSIDSTKIEGTKFELECVTLGTSIVSLSADSVKVSTRKRLIFPGPAAYIDKMYAKTVDIEGVRAKSIIAEKVIVRDHCNIDYVEAESISVSGKSMIKEQRILQT